MSHKTQQQPSFAQRREALAEIASDAEVIAADLARFARALGEYAVTLTHEVESMKRAEARFAARVPKRAEVPTTDEQLAS